MPTLSSLVSAVNDSDLVLLPMLAVLGLATVITAGRVVKQALSTAMQLIETAINVGLLSIMVLAAMFAAVWLLLTK